MSVPQTESVLRIIAKIKLDKAKEPRYRSFLMENGSEEGRDRLTCEGPLEKPTGISGRKLHFGGLEGSSAT